MFTSHLIVVEGPDGAGKSRLVEKFEEHLKVKSHHDGGPPEGVEALRRRLTPSPDVQLMDRWSAISEQVYGSILRGDTLVSHEELLAAIVKINPLIIYCRPPDRILFQNLSVLKRKKAHKSEEHCDSVMSKYWDIVFTYDKLMTSLTKMGLYVVRYDYSGESLK